MQTAKITSFPDKAIKIQLKKFYIMLLYYYITIYVPITTVSWPNYCKPINFTNYLKKVISNANHDLVEDIIFLKKIITCT